MIFPRAAFMGGGGVRPATGFTSWIDAFNRNQNTEIRYEKEVGDLTKSALVMTAVNWLGRRIPEPPIRVFAPDDEGEIAPIPDHPLADIFNRPNPFYTGKTMWKTWGLNWIINGNVYWRIIKSARGNPVQLWPIPFWMIRPRWNENDPTEYIGYYEYKVNNTKIEIPPEEIIHWRDGEDPDNDRLGMSPLRALLRQVYQDNEIANWAAQLMRNGGIPDFILSPSENAASLSDDEALFIKEEFQRRRTGDERGKAVMATRGMKVERLTFDPKSMDLSKIADMPQAMFAAVIGIPASALGLKVSMDRSIQSNVEGWGEDATQEYLIPLWNYIAEELTHQFLNEFEPGTKNVIKHELKKVAALQTDQDLLWTRIDAAAKSGWITVNQALTLAGLKPVEGLDVYLIPKSTLPMTAEALMEIANDPMTLQQAMPVEQALSGQPQQPIKALPGQPDKRDLRLMKESWLRHGKRPKLYLGNRNGQ